MFVSSKKNSLFLGDVTEKLAASAKVSTSAEEIKALIVKLVQICPDYISLVKISNGIIVKLNTKIALKQVKEKICK